MANSNDNDLDDKVQGARFDLILKAARSLGLADKTELDPDEAEQLLEVAGQSHLDLGTASTYLRIALPIDAVIGIDAFVRSDWNNNKHPQFLAKLCRYQPEWARLAFAEKYDRSDKYPSRNINRMRYEYLRDLAAIAKDGVTEKALASKHWPTVQQIMVSLEKRLRTVVCRIGDEVFELSSEKAAALAILLR